MKLQQLDPRLWPSKASMQRCEELALVVYCNLNSVGALVVSPTIML